MTPKEYTDRMHRAMVQAIANDMIERGAVQLKQTWIYDAKSKTMRFTCDVEEMLSVAVDFNMDSMPF